MMFYNPATTVSAGSLTSTTPLLLGGPAGSAPAFDLAGHNQQIASLADFGTPDVKGTVINSTSGSAMTLTLSAASGTTTYSGSIGAGINLVKAGGSTQILSGSLASYNGNTAVKGGTLTIVGSLNTPSANVTVASGATLTASSIVANTLTIGGAPTSSASSVPEPSVFVLLVLAGLGALLAWRRKQ
jgi:autotransporter-associated beta strand protein